MKQTILYVSFSILYFLITFFGIGPILLADGSMQERMTVLAVVILLYGLVTALFLYIRKKIQ